MVSTNPFYDKTKEFGDRIREFENNGDFDNAIKLANEAIAYIDGFKTNHVDEIGQLYYSNYRGLWALWRRMLESNKKMNEGLDEKYVRLNNLESRISTLEDKFKKLQGWKDKKDMK